MTCLSSSLVTPLSLGNLSGPARDGPSSDLFPANLAKRSVRGVDGLDSDRRGRTDGPATSAGEARHAGGVAMGVTGEVAEAAVVIGYVGVGATTDGAGEANGLGGRCSGAGCGRLPNSHRMMVFPLSSKAGVSGLVGVTGGVLSGGAAAGSRRKNRCWASDRTRCMLMSPRSIRNCHVVNKRLATPAGSTGDGCWAYATGRASISCTSICVRIRSSVKTFVT